MRERPWNILLPVVFALFSGRLALESILEPLSLGSHAAIYTEAAAAMLRGGDPWSVGPPAAVFAGPPPMLLPFVPFVGLPVDLTRAIWVIGSALLAIWALRRMDLPPYWLAFPPIFQAIQLGHPEILVLGLLVFGGALSGLAALIKPYAVLPLLAERRWTAMGLWVVGLIVLLPFLPWRRFIEQFPEISATLASQSHGDSVLGAPILVIVAGVALASLGLRRALWLATPILWPSAQPIYKVASVPAMSPVIALFWAVPVPGATLVGLVAEAIMIRLAHRRDVPKWLATGVGSPIRATGATT